MTNFLTRVIERHQHEHSASLSLIEPRLPSRFEPVGPVSEGHVVTEDAAVVGARPSESPMDTARRFVALEQPQPAAIGPPAVGDPRVHKLETALLAALSTIHSASQSHGTITERIPKDATPAPIPAGRPDRPSAPVSALAPRLEEPHPAPQATQRRAAPDARPVEARLSRVRDGSPQPMRASRKVEPIIHVTIGRIDVRAVASAPEPPRQTKTAAPKLSLDDYLQGRAQARR